MVHNKSKTTIRFSAKVVSIEPALPHYDQIPGFLQLDNADPPTYREANIEGEGDALVNVLAWVGDDPDKKRRLYTLVIASPLVMNYPSAGAI